MIDIPNLIQDLLSQFGTIDIAESEFKRQINEDENLKEEFKSWCDEMGYKERFAFVDYCHEYLDDQESAYDLLSDFNE